MGVRARYSRAVISDCERAVLLAWKASGSKTATEAALASQLYPDPGRLCGRVLRLEERHLAALLQLEQDGYAEREAVGRLILWRLTSLGHIFEDVGLPRHSAPSGPR